MILNRFAIYPLVSYVLQAMGISANLSNAIIRVSVGRTTTFDEVQQSILFLHQAISNA